MTNLGEEEITTAPSLTERLAGILSRPVGIADRRRAASHLRDWIACAVLGSRSDAGLALAGYGRLQGPGNCAAIGAGHRSAETAAFVNGGLGNIFEMDDVHRLAVMHPGDTAIPAALAVAEREAADGEALLDAIVRGYEASIRIGRAVGAGHYEHWYNTATCGIFGAASAAASIMKLDIAASTQALANAGMQFAGVWQCRIEPGFGKQLATAHAARSGVAAADLASVGFTGPRHILEGPHGLFKATGANGSSLATDDAHEEPWKIWETSFKPWPSCRVTHPVIEAALLSRNKIDPSAVARIEIETFRQAIDMCDRPAPRTPQEARFSLQHCAAVAMLAGEPELIHFESRWLDRADVSALRAKVTVRERTDMSTAFPVRQGASLKFDVGSGMPLHIELQAAKGDPEKPLTEQELERKARNLLGNACVDEPDADRLLAAIARVGQGRDIGELSQILAAFTDLETSMFRPARAG